MAGKSKGRPRKSIAPDAEQPTSKSTVAGNKDQAGVLENGNCQLSKVVEEKSVVEKNNNDTVGLKPAAARKRGHQKDEKNESTPVEADSASKTVHTEENNQSEENSAAKKLAGNVSSKSTSDEVGSGASEKGLLSCLTAVLGWLSSILQWL
jgi:hypothetical protein